MIILTSQLILLSESIPTFQTVPMVIGSLTSAIRITLQRPTTLVPLTWDSSGGVRITILESVDGRVMAHRGQASGGIRLNQKGEESLRYQFSVAPTIQFGQRA